MRQELSNFGISPRAEELYAAIATGKLAAMTAVERPRAGG
jgi:hypothetical protein